MLKMTLLLVVAVYGTLAIWGEPTGTSVAAPARAAIEEAVAESMPAYARPVILESADAGAPQVTRAATTRTIVPGAATIAADAAPSGGATIGEPRVVSLLDPEPAGTNEEPDASVDGMLRVTGSRVNMRSGPSTADAVVASLSEGTLAAPIGDPVEGWREVRVVETGQTGFMASRFLDPA